MKLDSSTRVLIVLCLLCAPVLGGAKGGCGGGQVAIGGDPGAAGSAGSGDPMGSGGSSSATGGGSSTTGGSSSTAGGSFSATGGGPADDCIDEEAALRGFLAANKACSTADDCQTAFAGCGVSEDDCTSAVYVNNATDLAGLQTRVRELAMCRDGTTSCAGCDRVAAAPACIAGQCLRFDTDVCSLPFEVGPCDAAFRVWAFVDGVCQQQIYGGCEGNANNFGTLEECEALCAPAGECPPNRVRRTVCLECDSPGGCGAGVEMCALLCDSVEQCGAGLNCFDGVCQVGPCI